MLVKMNLALMRMAVLGTVKVERTLEIMVTDVDGLEWVDRVLKKLLNGKKRYAQIIYGFMLSFFVSYYGVKTICVVEYWAVWLNIGHLSIFM